MAESQGVMGDMWNDNAVALLEYLNWDHIGDTNMDLPGSDQNEYGVDALTVYSSPLLDVLQSCVVESKRYSTKSISQSLIQKWIDRLRLKIDSFANSQALLDKFGALNEAYQINLGVIMCWVHDALNEDYFNTTFNSFIKKSIINTQVSKSGYKRIFVLTNPRIIRLCSMLQKIRSNEYEYKFIYPAQILGGKPLLKSKTLTIEYATSDFIFAERIKRGEPRLVVFYFGNLSSKGFTNLYDALIFYNLVEQDQKVIVYFYGSEVENRENLAEGKRIFKNKNLDVAFKPLPILSISTEPSILSKNSDQDD